MTNIFNNYFRPRLGPAERSVIEMHNLFDLTGTSGGYMMLSMCVEIGIDVFGLKVTGVEFLVIQNLRDVLDPEHSTKLPGIVGLNLIKLAYQEFIL